MFAANFGHLDVATALVDGGADLKVVDKEGYTVVDYCVLPGAGGGAIEVGKYLNSKGAPPTKMKANDTLSRLFGGTTEPDRLKKLIDASMK
jgi:ankyrin repeat protein